MNVADGAGLFFLDTNILVYTFDHSAPSNMPSLSVAGFL
jgi:hypothetical protein